MFGLILVQYLLMHSCIIRLKVTLKDSKAEFRQKRNISYLYSQQLYKTPVHQLFPAGFINEVNDTWLVLYPACHHSNDDYSIQFAFKNVISSGLVLDAKTR